MNHDSRNARSEGLRAPPGAIRLMAVVPAVFLLVGVATIGATAESITMATWNIEHLRDMEGEGRAARTENDYRRLRHYARLLDADVIAVQEVENPEALQRVFDPARYIMFLSDRHHAQRTGFAIRKSIPTKRHPDLEALNTSGGLRHGVDVEITVGGQVIRLLSVHLKAFCFEGSVVAPAKKDCDKLARQIPVLEKWIDDRAAEQTPFVVLGDFNRRFDASDDDFWAEIDDGEPKGLALFRTTEGNRANCNRGKYPLFIDHIVYDRLVSRWVVPGSFRELVYSDSDSHRTLSDHCPISVKLDVKQ